MVCCFHLSKYATTILMDMLREVPEQKSNVRSVQDVVDVKTAMFIAVTTPYHAFILTVVLDSTNNTYIRFPLHNRQG